MGVRAPNEAHGVPESDRAVMEGAPLAGAEGTAGMVPSPFRLELLEDVAVGEIQVDRRGRQAIVAEDLLHGRQGHPLLACQRRPGMAEHMRGDLPGELGMVRTRVDGGTTPNSVRSQNTDKKLRDGSCRTLY